MTDQSAILRAILTSPDDDLPRLAMADWLEENGQSDRAEFIRVQIALTGAKSCNRFMYSCCENILVLEELAKDGCEDCRHYAALAIRERELFWNLVPLFQAESPFGIHCVLDVIGDAASSLPVLRYRRGFVKSITLDAAAFTANAKALFLAQPIEKVKLVADPAALVFPSAKNQYYWFLDSGNNTFDTPLHWIGREFCDKSLWPSDVIVNMYFANFNRQLQAYAALDEACMRLGHKLCNAAWEREPQ